MRRSSTRLKISFFSLLLVAFIAIQYSWVRSLQKEKLQHFKSQLITGIESATKQIAYIKWKQTLTNSELTGVLQQSFASRGFTDIPFEFSMRSGNDQLTSRDFSEKLKENPGHLILYYELPPYGEQRVPEELLTIIIPFWQKIALQDMGLTIAAAVFITIMIVAIFCFAILLGVRGQQLFYDNRERAIKYMMQQLETPLTTVSVAAEALRRTTSMHDARQTNYYQQIINEENQRMNEQVEKCLRELK
jgi:two-component system, OmpR family, phosphate regulon sensor histidine kinase PhoR